jgi:hypothetical protein
MAGGGALIGHHGQVDPGLALEQLAREMRRCTGAEGPIGHFVWIGFRRRDQVRNRLDRGLGIYHDDVE